MRSLKSLKMLCLFEMVPGVLIGEEKGQQIIFSSNYASQRQNSYFSIIFLILMTIHEKHSKNESYFLLDFINIDFILLVSLLLV